MADVISALLAWAAFFALMWCLLKIDMAILSRRPSRRVTRAFAAFVVIVTLIGLFGAMYHTLGPSHASQPPLLASEVWRD